MCGSIFGRRARPWSERNVLVAVLVRCAVHTTLRPGNRMHSTTSSAPTKYVLPTWRGMLRTTPPTVEAYLPFARLPSTTRPRLSCHQSNVMPSSAPFATTCGQPVVTIPEGMTTWRAASDSRGVEGLVGDVGGTGVLLLLAG